MYLRMISGVLVAVCLFLFAGCGNRYDDVIKVNNEFIDAMDEYITGVGKATSAKDLTAVIDRYAEKIDKLAPRVKEVRTKYPDLANNDKLPEDLKKIEEKVAALQQKMAASFMTSMRFMADPAVQAAQERLTKAMEKME